MALKILLADDSMTAQNMGKKILTDAGYDVVAVSNGAAAVKKIAEISPQLCILDIYMPGYTGLEVCEKVKASSVTARMPVLLTVGKMEPYKPEEGARVRADGVIVKPFEASELLRAVQRFSQRIGAAPARPKAPAAPPPPPASTPGTYEKTVKLTREEMQEIIDPGLQHWNGGTTGPDVVANVPAINVEDVVATTKTASTADAMPTFTVQTAVAHQESPVAIADTPAFADFASLTSVSTPEPPEDIAAEQTHAAKGERLLPNASAILPGFVDYLLAKSSSVENSGATSAEHVEALEIADGTSELSVIHSVHGVRFTGVEILTDELQTSGSIDEEIPEVDPSLEVAPEVAVEVTPDPHLETAQDLSVENATEEGLQPTSRAAESENVVTTTDPNLAPMDGLTDASKPLEGGRLVIPDEDPVSFGEIPVEAPLPSAATEEIAAVLDLLGRTTRAEAHAVPQETATPAVDEGTAPAAPVLAGRVWMAEEVALTDSEATISLEKEMRVAYAPKAVDVQHSAQLATALAEEPVRDDNIAPKSGVPGIGGSSPEPAASPTQELAAAMAAAFGGALPEEDLARAEETQSISEEVRRFALGDAYKAKPAFGGASVEAPTDKVVNSAKLSVAIGRALDRMKPQLVAEILKQLELMDE